MLRRPTLLARLCLLALGIALVWSAVPAGAAATVVDVSRRPTNQAEAAVAVDPLDAANVAIVSNRESGYGVLVAVSHDGGTSWGRTVLGNDDAFGRACCDPSMTYDQYGNLFLSWLGFTRYAYPTVVTVLLSTDDGDSWALLDRINPPQARTRGGAIAFRRAAREDEGARGPGFVDQPTIAAGPHALWAVWSVDDVTIEAAGARVHGRGDIGSFGQIQDVKRSHRCRFGDIAVGPKGIVATVCQRDITSKKPVRSELRVSFDADGLKGGGFGPPVMAATTGVTTFEPIPAQRKRTIDAESALVWIRTGPLRGRLVLLFTDEHPDESDNTNVHTKVSDDAGATWSGRSPVTNAHKSQFLPRIAIDPVTGHLAAGWHDASLDTGSGPYDTDGVPNTDAMYAMSFSVDGVTWAPPQMVSEGPSNAAASKNYIQFGDYTGLAFVGGVAHPAWADNSNSTGDNPDGALHAFDVYSASVAEF
jgi:hypothetical protein